MSRIDKIVVLKIFASYLFGLTIFLLLLVGGFYLIIYGAQAAQKNLTAAKFFWKWKAKYPYFSTYILFQLLYGSFSLMGYICNLSRTFDIKFLIGGFLGIFIFQGWVWHAKGLFPLYRRVNGLFIGIAFVLTGYVLLMGVLASSESFISRCLLGITAEIVLLVSLAWLHYCFFRKKPTIVRFFKGISK